MKKFEVLRDQNGKYGIWSNKHNCYKFIGKWLSNFAPSIEEAYSVCRSLNQKSI